MADARPVLSLRGATKRFGAVVALNAIDLDVEPGTFTGLVGPNGSGKTTLFEALSGFVPLDAGTLRLDGRVVARPRAHLLARAGIARTFQDCRVWPDLSIEENLLLAVAPWNAALLSRRTVDANTRVQLRQLMQEVALDSSQSAVPATQLPLLERRRLELARALAMTPRVLLVDEIAAGLNPLESHALYGLLRAAACARPGLAVIAIEHKLDLLTTHCDRVWGMEAGSIRLLSVRDEERRIDHAISGTDTLAPARLLH